MVEVDLNYLNILGSVILPILVGLVTKRIASSGVKALLLVVLSVISGLVQELVVAGGVFTWESFGTHAFVQFLMAVGIHYGLAKPLGITGSNGVIQQKVPGGIGGTLDASDPNGTGV